MTPSANDITIARAKVKAPPDEVCAPIKSWYDDELAINGQRRTMGGRHDGFDVAAKIGTPVIAAAPGIVAQSTWQGISGYVVWIYHGQDTQGDQIYTLSAHLNERKVQKGDRVKRGQLIGLSGDTGSGVGKEGPHLHFGVTVHESTEAPLTLESLKETAPASLNFYLYPLSGHAVVPLVFPKWIPQTDYGDSQWLENQLFTGLTFPVRCKL